MLKKLTLLMLLLAAICNITISADKHAVIITGDYRHKDAGYEGKSFSYKWWNDTVLLWYLLVKQQDFKPENVYVLFASGKDYPLTQDQGIQDQIPDQYWMDRKYSEYGYNYYDEAKPKKYLTYSSASEGNIEDIFDSLSTNNVMTDDDLLFVATITHGGQVLESTDPMDGEMLIWGDDINSWPMMTDFKFAEEIAQVPANKKVIWLAQCHSGTFVDNLENMDDGSYKIINAACKFDEISRIADDQSWVNPDINWGNGIEFEHLFELYPEEYAAHDEFTFHMYTSTAGNRPFAFDDIRDEVRTHYQDYQRPSATAPYEWFPISDADLNNDGVISASESFEWLDKYESIDWIDGQTSVFSGLAEVSCSTSLLYPTIIYNIYPLYLSTIKGIMAIPLDLQITGKNLILPANSNTTLFENKVVSIKSGYSLTIKDGAVLKMLAGSEIIVEEGASLIIEEGSNLLIEGNAKITGNVQISSNAIIEIFENSSLSFQFSQLTIHTGTVFELGKDAKLIIMNGSHFVTEQGAGFMLDEGAEIIVWTKAYLTATGTTFSYTGSTGKWLGINCIGGSTVEFNNVKITGAETGVKGISNYKFIVKNSVFENCDNGIEVTELIPYVNYIITDNSLTGTEVGTGVSITSSNGVFKNNSIYFFLNGTNFIMSSPIVTKNTIAYNKRFGIMISGQNAIPQLKNYDQNQFYNALNNSIYDNGNIYTNPSPLFLSAQIGIIPYASVYMDNGKNNIYSGNINQTPTIPCMSIAKYLAPHQDNIIIEAANNYWGSRIVNSDFFFEDHIQYTIEYTPYAEKPYSTGGSDPSTSPLSTESRILSNAVNLEDKENYTAALAQYNHIIKKYEDSPEYYVAMARLPYLYAKAEMDNNELISIYDEAYASENTSNKKFFKGMKVAAHIKGKRYDDAIGIAEEMKAEAEFEEEIILADINIAIANLLKEMDSAGKRGVEYTENLHDLISKLSGIDSKTDPKGISESVLPVEHTLYQNYPNPFNPVTQIKFDLAKTANIKLSVYNINGQLVSELASGVKNAGYHVFDFDGSKLNSGIYYYTLEVDGRAITKKMVLMK